MHSAQLIHVTIRTRLDMTSRLICLLFCLPPFLPSFLPLLFSFFLFSLFFLSFLFPSFLFSFSFFLSVLESQVTWFHTSLAVHVISSQPARQTQLDVSKVVD